MAYEEKLKRLIEAYSKNIDGNSKSRWKRGYVDGLKDALKLYREAERDGHDGRD